MPRTNSEDLSYEHNKFNDRNGSEAEKLARTINSSLVPVMMFFDILQTYFDNKSTKNKLVLSDIYLQNVASILMLLL